MRLVVERISENFVILEKEDMTHTEVEIGVLPEGIKEGNILVFDGEKYLVDYNDECETRRRIAEKQRAVFKNR